MGLLLTVPPNDIAFAVVPGQVVSSILSHFPVKSSNEFVYPVVPDEIISYILLFVYPPTSLFSCFSVCSTWAKLSNNLFFRSYCEKWYDVKNYHGPPQDRDWKWVTRSKQPISQIVKLKMANAFYKTHTFIGSDKISTCEIYEGEWMGGQRNGKGVAFIGKNCYMGDFVKNFRNGKGKLIWETGEVYEGDWLEGKMTGHGKATWYGKGNQSTTKEDVYEGQWVDGKKHGKGNYMLSNGAVYEGELVGDKREGKGRYTKPDGTTYDGDWLAGKREGKGKYTKTDGTWYEGYWVDGKKHGHGKSVKAGCVYEGEWVRGKKEGKGRLVKPSGTVYEGQFVNGKLSEGTVIKATRVFNVKNVQVVKSSRLLES